MPLVYSGVGNRSKGANWDLPLRRTSWGRWSISSNKCVWGSTISSKRLHWGMQ